MHDEKLKFKTSWMCTRNQKLSTTIPHCSRKPSSKLVHSLYKSSQNCELRYQTCFCSPPLSRNLHGWTNWALIQKYLVYSFHSNLLVPSRKMWRRGTFGWCAFCLDALYRSLCWSIRGDKMAFNIKSSSRPWECLRTRGICLQSDCIYHTAQAYNLTPKVSL